MAVKKAPKPGRTEKIELTYPRGYRSFEVASFLAQLDDLHERLRDDTRGLTAAELEWQPRPGVNSIGMLLAHIAVVEVYWYNRALEVKDPFALRPTLGLDMDDDGMPLATAGLPPRTLRGRRLPYFRLLLKKARDHRRMLAKRLREGDLDKRIEARRQDGTMRIIEKRWILYHVVEHTAGHYYQVNTLRRMYALEKRRRPRNT